MTDATPRTDRARPRWRVLAVLLVASVAVRLAIVTVPYGRLRQDPDAYRQIAENLVQRGVYSRTPLGKPVRPTAFRPPLYPLLLAALNENGHVTSARVATLHVVLGCLTVLLTFLVANSWGLGRAAWLAAGCVACDPILLNQSAQVMTETVATFLAISGLWILTYFTPHKSRRNALVSGLAIGTASLCRPTFLIWAALAGVYLFWNGRTIDWRRIGHVVALAAGVGIALLPWAARNWHALGRPVLATTHGGYTLLLGNNRFFYRHLRTQPWGSVWDARELQVWLEQQVNTRHRRDSRTNEEIYVDQRLYGLAWDAIRREPLMFVYACAVRLMRIWSPLPHQQASLESVARRLLRYAVAIWYVAVYAVASVVAFRHTRRLTAPPWIWGLLLILAFSVVHTVYWSNLRMRAPLMPFAYIVAAAWWLPTEHRRTGPV